MNEKPRPRRACRSIRVLTRFPFELVESAPLRTQGCGIAVPLSRWAWSRVEKENQADGANYRLPLHLAVAACACIETRWITSPRYAYIMPAASVPLFHVSV